MGWCNLKYSYECQCGLDVRGWCYKWITHTLMQCICRGDNSIGMRWVRPPLLIANDALGDIEYRISVHLGKSWNWNDRLLIYMSTYWELRFVWNFSITISLFFRLQIYKFKCGTHIIQINRSRTKIIINDSEQSWMIMLSLSHLSHITYIYTYIY